MSDTEQTLSTVSPVGGAGGEQRFGPYRSNTGHMFWVEYAGGKTRSIWVHREIVEKKLGRKLLRSEIVHHVNHDKTDNRAENLEVMARGDHVRHHQTGDAKRKAALRAAAVLNGHLNANGRTHHRIAVWQCRDCVRVAEAA